MPIETTYAAIASMDVPVEKEDLFNEIYDEHVTFLLEVPGVRSVTRMKGEPFEISIAGEIKSMPAPDPVYTAIYELDTPEVMQTAEWAEAVEKGRWAAEIRPFTRGRTHSMYRKL